MNLPNLPSLLVPYELSDEAAAHVSELLNDLAVAFDGQYFAQIRRYYDERRDIERLLPGRTTRPLRLRRRRVLNHPPPALPGVGCAGQSIFTTTPVIIAITVAPPCPSNRTAPARLSDDDGSM